MKRFLFTCLLLQSIASFAQQKNKKLEDEIKPMISGFHGEIGVFVKDLTNHHIVYINAGAIFPTASMVKIPILIGLMDKIKKGELNYHQDLIYKDSLLYPGIDILGSFKSNEKIELSKVMMLMLTMSDNTASLWLQSLAGGGTRINTIIDSLGFMNTRVNSRTEGRENERSQYGWGQTTPLEMAGLMEKIYRKEIFSDSSCIRMMRLLSRNYWDEVGISQVPPTVSTFSKNGAVDDSRSEVVLVNAPHRPYVYCICTKNNMDQSWETSNEAWVLERKIAKLLWQYFEPKYK
jgi:beta-lactamase class A